MDPNDLMGGIAARLRDLRRGRGFTVRETARRSGISPRFYQALEAGTVNVSVRKLAAVAEALGTSLAELFRPNGRRPVALLGLRGAGKSTIGKKLARALGWPFVELDERIERAAGLSLAEIFSLHGEPYYRKLEGECVSDILRRGEPCVLALPGGVVRNEAAFAAIRNACTTVWLQATPEDHMRRVRRQGDRRPMANRVNAMEELKNILRDREPLYRLAEVHVNTSAQSVTSTVLHLAGLLKGRPPKFGIGPGGSPRLPKRKGSKRNRKRREAHAAEA